MTEPTADEFDSEEYDVALTSRPAPIRSVEIRQLFGRYSYRVKVPDGAASDRLVLFYGDNGRGKTTLLRLLWHLLSPAKDREHRARIAEVPFKSFSVSLEDGTVFIAERPAPVDGPYYLTVTRHGRTLSQGTWPATNDQFSDWDLETLRELTSVPAAVKEAVDSEIARQTYLEVLTGLSARPYFLADDRNIYSDDLDRDPADRRTRDNRLSSGSHPSGRVLRSGERSSVAAELQASLTRASGVLRRMTLGGTQSGSANANGVYLDVLTRIASLKATKGVQPLVLSNLAKRIELLGERSRPFEELQLVPQFPASKFIEVLDTVPQESIALVDEVLAPYMRSIDARLDALAEAQSLISTYLSETNGYLRDKHLLFRPQLGLRIQSGDTRLTPDQLSSGERQLVLLLSNALLARQGSRLFLIDEPELSLNVKWQRRILDSLLEITEGTSVQFLIATHSVELLSKYVSNVVRLEDIVDG